MTFDPLDAGMLAASRLEAESIPCAIGGALALGIWGVPRATLDVDLNVFVEAHEVKRTVEILVDLGLDVDADAARAAAEADGWFSGKLSGIRIDVFVSSIPFSAEAARTRKRVELEGRSVPFLSMEALAVFKMLFFRPKDVVDLERLLALQPDLDRAYVRAHLVEMVGEDDVRIARWDEFERS